MENTSNSILLNQNNQKFFSNDNGFGKYKLLAVELLKNR